MDVQIPIPNSRLGTVSRVDAVKRPIVGIYIDPKFITDDVIGIDDSDPLVVGFVLRIYVGPMYGGCGEPCWGFSQSSFPV